MLATKKKTQQKKQNNKAGYRLLCVCVHSNVSTMSESFG